MRYVIRIFCLLACVCTLAGCSFMQRVYLADDVWRAEKRYEQQQFGMAAAQYRYLIDVYPEGPKREELMLRIGDCMYHMHAHKRAPLLHDAQSVYLDYLEEYPDGAYRAEAEQSLERIRAIIANRDQAAQARLDEIANDVDKLKSAISDSPYSAELHLQLGHTLWKLERYDEAVEAYRKGQEIDAALKEFDLIKNRMTVDERGEVIPVTPEMRRLIDREENPLVIFEVNDYKSRLSESFYTPGEVYYNVIGKVLNQSSRYLNNVRVRIDFYNAARQLLDSKTAVIGNMPPGAVRVFSVKATNYDNLLNITRYECDAYGY